MLLTGAAIIGLVLSILGYVLGVYSVWWGIPIAWVLMGLAVILVWIVCCFIYTRFISFNKDVNKHSKVNRFFANCVIDTVRQFYRVKMHVSGMELVPQEKFLLVCNHRSNMDPILTMGVFSKYNMGFVAKKELYKIPVISRLMHKCFCLCLDRGNVKESAKVIIRAGEIVGSGLASVGIYPEGTRSREEEMLPFMHGAFKIAKKAESPIVVTTIKNTELAAKNFPWKKTDVYLDIIGVIDADVVKAHNTVELSGMARELMENHLAELKKMELEEK